MSEIATARPATPTAATGPQKTRFAPTPSGFLHLGNVFNLLLAERWRDRTGGRILLRMDDLDRARVRREYVADTFAVARWLGIRFDEGPTSPSDFESGWSQSLRADRYARALADLAEGGRVFACTCSRHEVAGATIDGGYPGTCRARNLPLDTPDAAWRLRLDENGIDGPPEPSLRDPVVRRKDGAAAYHVASIVDDVEFGITVILRGYDLEPSSRLQRAIARVMGLESFASIALVHHPLVTGADGAKLSKSAGAQSRGLQDDPDLTPQGVRDAFERWVQEHGGILPA